MTNVHAAHHSLCFLSALTSESLGRLTNKKKQECCYSSHGFDHDVTYIHLLLPLFLMEQKLA